MTNPRMRLAAVAGSMALALSITATPAMAQDDPTATIQGFMDAVAAKDFEALPAYFCEDQADQAAQFDISEMAGEMPEGMDVQSLLDAFIFDIQLDSMDVVSQDEAEAVVRVVGSMAMDIDPEALKPFVAGLIEMSGMEADEATIEMFLGMITAEFEAESEDIDDDVTLVADESGAWLICSDLDFGDDDMMDDDMMDDDMSDDDMDDADDMDDDMDDDDMEDDGE